MGLYNCCSATFGVRAQEKKKEPDKLKIMGGQSLLTPGQCANSVGLCKSIVAVQWLRIFDASGDMI